MIQQLNEGQRTAIIEKGTARVIINYQTITQKIDLMELQATV